MTAMESIALLGDIDAMIREAQSPASRVRLKKLGLEIDGLPRLLAARARLADGIDPRWTFSYERTRQRYGRGIAAVRDRVCSGCFVTLPTTARPRDGDSPSPQHCESCGRILYPL